MPALPKVPSRAATPITPITAAAAMLPKRRSSGMKRRPEKACQTLVIMVGRVMMASASPKGSESVITPMAIGGRPMPIAPLAMPARMKAPATTSICISVMAPWAQAASGKTWATKRG